MINKEISCPTCHVHFVLAYLPDDLTVNYCPFCRKALSIAKDSTIPLETQKDTSGTTAAPSISFLPEHLPEEKSVQFTVGPYQVLQSIGKGGMGEVFLAYDTTCGRRIALKKIRPDLIEYKQLHNRFLKEARITCQLTHPAIIPIYAIHSEDDIVYYTMPFIEGQTLKHLLRTARKQERRGGKLDHLTESIPALIRIFLSICQAVAYAHSKKVLHRDLKPENIIVGQYGQIIILDWGLAKMLKTDRVDSTADFEVEESMEGESLDPHQLTRMGKVVGTVAYMAPERAMGSPANFQTDIYSLGIILYQLLTLKQPFRRGTLKEYREYAHKEKLLEPVEVAPYRDVSRSLSRVVMKCLSTTPEQRYRTVDELIHDLENYIEGRSEWFQIATLDIKNKADWEFQENVLIAEHIAITREAEASDWVSLMISKASFQENIKLEAKVKIGEKGHGIGFLLSIPEAAERVHLNDGYCLWIGSEKNKSTKLLRSTVEVIHAPDIFLKCHIWYQARIEKIDNNIYFYLNNALQFSYISHLPLVGTHIGLLSRDADFIIEDFSVDIGSQNVMVNCLAVPDAFLAHKDYATALSEYRRIGYSFPGRAEGREAMFRAGITLLEQANNTDLVQEKAHLYDLAHEEFRKLHNTPGAPLEYLGKALIYQVQGDNEDEVKCFELAYRRYPHHPLLPILEEQVIYRMHDSSRYDRQATFNFVLFALRHLPKSSAAKNTKKLLHSMEKHWEPLFFIEYDHEIVVSEGLKNISFALHLAFWLARIYIIQELLEKMRSMISFHGATVGNMVFCLIELGAWKMAKAALGEIRQYLSPIQLADFNPIGNMLDLAISSHRESLDAAVNAFMHTPRTVLSHPTERTLLYLMDTAIDANRTDLIHLLFQNRNSWQLSAKAQENMQHCEIWALLLDKNWTVAGEMLHHYPLEILSQDTTLLHFLYGCWLYVTEGKDIANIHFSGVFEVPYPRTWTLFSYFITGKIHEEHAWVKRSFLWERRQLYRQMALFFHCSGEDAKSHHYRLLAEQQKIPRD